MREVYLIIDHNIRYSMSGTFGNFSFVLSFYSWQLKNEKYPNSKL